MQTYSQSYADLKESAECVPVLGKPNEIIFKPTK